MKVNIVTMEVKFDIHIPTGKQAAEKLYKKINLKKKWLKS